MPYRKITEELEKSGYKFTQCREKIKALKKHKEVPYGVFFSRITNFANFAEKFVIREIYFLEF